VTSEQEPRPHVPVTVYGDHLLRTIPIIDWLNAKQMNYSARGVYKFEKGVNHENNSKLILFVQNSDNRGSSFDKHRPNLEELRKGSEILWLGLRSYAVCPPTPLTLTESVYKDQLIGYQEDHQWKHLFLDFVYYETAMIEKDCNENQLRKLKQALSESKNFRPVVMAQIEKDNETLTMWEECEKLRKEFNETKESLENIMSNVTNLNQLLKDAEQRIQAQLNKCDADFLRPETTTETGSWWSFDGGHLAHDILLKGSLSLNGIFIGLLLMGFADSFVFNPFYLLTEKVIANRAVPR